MANSRNRTAAAASRASGHSARVGRAAPRARAATSSNPALWIGVAAAAVAVVVIIAMSTSGAGDASAGGRQAVDSPAETKQPDKPQPAPAAAPNKSAGSFAAKPGKEPKVAAPAIPTEVFAQAESHYEAAKAKWNEGQVARRTSDHETYTTALKVAYDDLEAFRTVTEKYTDWYNEADLEGWAMPVDYVRLGELLTRFDTLRSKVQKLKTR